MKKLIVTLIFVIGAFCIQAQTVSQQDKKFAEEAAITSLMEIKLGELAQTNAFSEEVKTLGKHMVDDHSKAYDDIKALALAKGFSVPTSINGKVQDKCDMLSTKAGKEFDKAYTACMVKCHKKTISKFKKEVKKGSDDQIKTWAATTIPKLKAHKLMSKEIHKTVKRINKSKTKT